MKAPNVGTGSSWSQLSDLEPNLQVFPVKIIGIKHDGILKNIREPVIL